MLLQFHQLSLLLLLLIIFFINITSTEALDFLFNSFNTTDLTLINDARVESSVILLTNDSNQFSSGRAFYPSTIPIQLNNPTNLSSFSTSFVFSILPRISNSPGFGLAFVLSNSTSPPGAIASQYFGIFSNSTIPLNYPLLAIEFDTGQNPEFNDPDDNHVGIDFNSMGGTLETQSAGYYDSSNGAFVPINMKNGQNIRAWVDFDGPQFEINVTIAPINVSKPLRPLIKFRNPLIANYVSSEMFVGFSASKTTWVEHQRILAWSFSNNGIARDIDVTNLPDFLPESSSSSKSLSDGVIAGIVIACVIGTLLILLGLAILRRKRQRQRGVLVTGKNDSTKLDTELPIFKYDKLAVSTNNFDPANKLGEGGFGAVYKGKLPDGQEIAVKRLSSSSRQGTEEFKNEVLVISKLQHRNLVRLLGCCIESEEKMLIYEYMPNKSLDAFLFDPNKKAILGWKKCFQIIEGIGRGILYLHRDSRLRVIHRDLKPSNILLDKDLNPKISDFGMARIVGGDELEANTRRVVGTYGYMSPEYAMEGLFSEKSDVYSFGVLLLEIVSGRKNTSFYSHEESLSLIKHAWKLWNEDKIETLIDPAIFAFSCKEEILRCMNVGLLCVQDSAKDRPTISTTILMLTSEISSLPAPKQPAFSSELELSHSSNKVCISNNVSVTTLDGR